MDKRKYPCVMGVIAQLWHGDAMADNNEWLLAAFCGEECRGIAQVVGDGKSAESVLMMNVYGTGNEPINFRVMNRETGEILDAAEQELFRTDIVGSMQQPYTLHIGMKTGVQTIDAATEGTMSTEIYDLQGRRVTETQMSASGTSLQKGIYVITNGKKSQTQKIVKR